MLDKCTCTHGNSNAAGSRTRRPLSPCRCTTNTNAFSLIINICRGFCQILLVLFVIFVDAVNVSIKSLPFYMLLLFYQKYNKNNDDWLAFWYVGDTHLLADQLTITCRAAGQSFVHILATSHTNAFAACHRARCPLVVVGDFTFGCMWTIQMWITIENNLHVHWSYVWWRPPPYSPIHLRFDSANIHRHSYEWWFLFCECTGEPMVSSPMNLDCRMVAVDPLDTCWWCGTYAHAAVFLHSVTTIIWWLATVWTYNYDWYECLPYMRCRHRYQHPMDTNQSPSNLSRYNLSGIGRVR